MKARMGFLFIGILVLPFALLVGGRLPYFLLYSYLTALLLPLCHVLLGKQFLKVDLQLPPKVMAAGEEITLRYEITNSLFIPFPTLAFHNEIAARLTGKSTAPIFLQLNWRDTYSSSMVIPCHRRGIYQMGKVKLVISDIFNLYSLSKTILCPLTLKIYPKIVPLESINIEASQYMGELAVMDPLFQNYDALSHLRQYQEGDSFKKIHWKASAKVQQLVVKSFEARGDNQVNVVLDSSKANYTHDQEGWIEDQLVEVALSLIDICLKANIQVNLYFYQESGIQAFRGSHRGDMKGFLEKLVGFHPTSKQAFLDAMELTAVGLQPGSTLFVLTPVMNKTLGAQGIRLKRSGFRPVYFIPTKQETTPKQPYEDPMQGKIAGYLKQEGIPFYSINVEEEKPAVWEVGHEN